MDSKPLLISTQINQDILAPALVDSGCLSYGVVDSHFVQKHGLERIRITPREMEGFDGVPASQVTAVAVVNLQVGQHNGRAFLYIVPRLMTGINLILGLSWMRLNGVLVDAERMRLQVGRHEKDIVQCRDWAGVAVVATCRQVSACAFMMQSRRKRAQVFSASMADIEKALRKREEVDPRTRLPEHFQDLLDAFGQKGPEPLPPLRGAGIDHQIELEQKDGKEQEVPWGPLYRMSREELLVLRETLTDLLDKGFIRVSHSPAAAPVLFVKKPGGGLRFCVDYRGLNKITRKDRYPLPLIYETLQNISRAKWFTKLDVKAAFYKLRVAEGDEWKTAFRTRYGLYEWLVTPFGLANAPSTFQKYINWVLRDYLDVFCSAYIDDVLIYTNGSRARHRKHTRQVICALRDAGLQLDITKCEFEVTTTKYLGFIISSGSGISMDPEKVEAIKGWEAPRSVKGVQSFLGFANFYRRFIKSFSEVAKPLNDLVKKDQSFRWTEAAAAAFDKLKEMFTTAPFLAHFDPDAETVVETDASGWCVGGVLLQLSSSGSYHPCAFFSKKMAPAECNYEIYDKEMLAIVRCLEEWDPELRSVKTFQIRSDHKNLQYFMSVQKLTERQMRWSLILSKYNFTISYLPGKSNATADALSRREQDMPNGDDDERVSHRSMRLLRPEVLPGVKKGVISAAAVAVTLPEKTTAQETGQASQDDPQPEAQDLVRQWEEARREDETYRAVVQAVTKGARRLPTALKLKVSVAECEVIDGELYFRRRRWVPESKELRTRIIQETHDSLITGHPGREATAAILARQFFWPGMLQDVRQFVRNCDTCGSSRSWRDRRQGLLKPLPVPQRQWREISMDFVDKLPLSNGKTNLLVITDRLGKGVILEGMESISAEAVAEVFIRIFYRRHGLPAAIVSDRGTQFTGALWKRVCQLLQITRRLSTAFHPETDGATERMNQEVEVYLRSFVVLAQDNWDSLLPMAELAINNRDATTTGVSPFFLSHGYHMEPLHLFEDVDPVDTPRSPVQQADTIVAKIVGATEWAQVAMAVAQQEQEDTANRHRSEGTAYQVGDLVWLNLRNVRTTRPCKKLDWKNAKFQVTEVVGSHSYRLNTPPGIHNVFHSVLLRPASIDPLPFQITRDPQPPAVLVDGQEEFEVEKVLKEKWVRQGRGRQRQLYVKWKGYAQPTWEPATAFEETVALANFDATLQARERGVM